jgi:hypothetical protein
LAGGAATIALSQSGTDDRLTAREIVQQAQQAYAALSSYSDTGTVVSEGGGSSTTTTFSTRLQRPDLYRIDWKQTGGLYTGIGVVWSDGNGNFFAQGAAGQEKTLKPEKMQNMQMALGAATGVSGSAASTVPAAFFNQSWGNVLGAAASDRSRLEKANAEQAAGVDCVVVSYSLGPMKLLDNKGTTGTSTTTLWIGKRDHLIHQARSTTEGASLPPLPESDDALKTILERQKKSATPEAIAALRAELQKSMTSAQGAKFVFTQTHENIVVNKKFSPADFTR